jgi:hypothetical protein
MACYGMFLSEGVAGALFPIDVLPPTYWLEGMRRALLGPLSLPSPLSGWEHTHLALALVGSTLALCAVAHWFFRWSEDRAWRLGRHDAITGY